MVPHLSVLKALLSIQIQVKHQYMQSVNDVMTYIVSNFYG